MKVGMLWFDNDPKAPLEVKVQRAAAYYQKKYGQSANLCIVHPGMLDAAECQVGTITVKTSRAIRDNHFWMGVEQP